MAKYYKPQLDDLYRIDYPELKGTKTSTLRPCLCLEIADGYALMLPYSTQDTYYDINGKRRKRGELDIKQPPFGRRDKAGWLAFGTAAWFKLTSDGYLKANADFGYAPKKYADEAWQGWLTYCKATGYKPPFFG